MNQLKQIIISKKFLPVVFIFFTLQALFYAWYIGFGIPSDENYHFGSIQYYAQQSVTTGPFTHGQDPSSLHIVHAIDRSPRYLYHYLMSFPLRLMDALHLSMHTEVQALRFINVAFAVLGLYVLKKCLDEISKDALIKNFTIFAVTMTGMAVWVAGSINYDNLANLLFLVFVLVSLKFIKKPDPLKLLAAITLILATTLTKYTLLPTMLLTLAVALTFAWRKGYRHNSFLEQFKQSFHARKALTVATVALLVLFSGLFIERDVMNLVRYRAIQPSCTEFFSVDQCRTYNVFNRNFKQQRDYTPEAKSYLVSRFDPTSFSGEWIYGMYNTLFFQLGDRRFESAAANRVFASILLAAIVVTAFFSRARLRLSKAGWLVFAIAAFYVIELYLFNMHTLFAIGKKYAYQGRYILPVLGFVYFFTILVVINTYRSRKPASRRNFGYAWLAVVLMFLIMHFPPLLLARYTAKGNPSWRETFVLPPEIID